MADVENVYTIPLGKAADYPHVRRAAWCIKFIRSFLIRHLKTDDVIISTALNEHIWSRGIEKPPRRVKVRAVKKDNLVKAYLHDEKIEEKPGEKPEEKPKAKTKEKSEGKSEDSPDRASGSKPDEKPAEKKQENKEHGEKQDTEKGQRQNTAGKKG